MKQSDLELMRYHDFESDADERRRVEDRLVSDEAARDYLASLEASAGAVRRWGNAVPLDGIADDVMRRIEHEASRGNRVRTLRRWSWSLVGSALAAAACLWLWVGGGVVESSGPTPTPLAQLPTVVPPAEQAQPLAEVGPGVAIEKLDFGANNGSIFVVQGSNVATPVVWLSDPEGDQAKMEPL